VCIYIHLCGPSLQTQRYHHGQPPPVCAGVVVMGIHIWEKVIEVEEEYRWYKTGYGRKVVLGQQAC
jgi:hypothetical protein